MKSENLSIHELEKELDHIFTSHKDDYLHHLEVVSRWGEEKRICGVLNSILEQPHLIDQIASRSYKHGNGFDKIVLLSSKEHGYKLRLHIWWPDEMVEYEEDIHDHRWIFSSMVMSGSLRVQQFAYSEEGNASEYIKEYRYMAPEGRKHYFLETVGETQLKCVSENNMMAGTSYFLSHEIMHRVIYKGTNLTSTLMLQGAPLRNWTKLLTNRAIEKPEKIDLAFFESEQLTKRIEKYMNYHIGE